jgi:hypothetical protein
MKSADFIAGTHGSLLLMRGGTQEHWLHQVPKTMKDVPERLNLTFQFVVQRPPAAQQ